MILTYGDVALLDETPWYALELRSNKTAEETIKRIGKAMPSIFKNDPAEVFVPIQNRDLDKFELMTECYIFARSVDVNRVSKLRQILGVVQIASKNDVQRPSHYLKMPNDYVQELIKQCEDAHYQRPMNVSVGSFVRIIDGHTRDFCGTVLSMNSESCCIRLTLKTKEIVVETPICNVVDLSFIPEHLRVFYYSDAIQETVKDLDADEAIELLAVDRVCNLDDAFRAPSPAVTSAPAPVKKAEGTKTPRSRVFTVTAFVTRQIFGGCKDVHELVNRTTAALNAKQLRPPKNLTILWHAIKTAVLAEIFKDDAKIKTYQDVLDEYGDDWKVSMKTLEEQVPWLPVKTGEATVEKALQRQRPKTVSAYVRRYLRDNKDWDMAVLLQSLSEGLKLGTLKMPANANTFIHVLKQQVLAAVKSKNPDIKTYSDVVSKYGSTFRITLKSVSVLFPQMRIHKKVKTITVPDANPAWVQERVQNA
jgi:transcription antitermination factor NusG